MFQFGSSLASSQPTSSLDWCSDAIQYFLISPHKKFQSQLTQSIPDLLQSKETMVHFTVACLVAKPLNRSEAKGDLVLIQTFLLSKCKLLCYHADQILVSITTRSPSASLQVKGLATEYTTVKWAVCLPSLHILITKPCSDLKNWAYTFQFHSRTCRL